MPSYLTTVFLQFCFAHDTARVIQCLIQFGTPEQRDIVFEELKGRCICYPTATGNPFVITSASASFPSNQLYCFKTVIIP